MACGFVERFHRSMGSEPLKPPQRAPYTRIEPVVHPAFRYQFTGERPRGTVSVRAIGASGAPTQWTAYGSQPGAAFRM